MTMNGIPVATEIEEHRQTGVHVSNQPAATSYFRQLWQRQGTVVAGTWVWGVTGWQTDYATVTGDTAGVWYNDPPADLDEYKWSDIYLAPGTYTISIITQLVSNRGIVEILFGTTSCGVADLYAVTTVYNVLRTFSLTVSTPTTADIRFRANGKNASSTGYYAPFSRIWIEKTG